MKLVVVVMDLAVIVIELTVIVIMELDVIVMELTVIVIMELAVIVMELLSSSSWSWLSSSWS